MIELADGVIRFTHPLLASVLYQDASAQERRRAHARLAESVNDPIARARHQALASDEPDAEIAAALEQAAALASAQGAPIVAAELGEHALRLTPSDLPEERHRRTITTARAHMAAGDLSHAEALARDLLARSPAGRRRAEALVLLSDVGPDVIELRRDALHEAAADPDLQARIHQRLSWESFFTEGPQVAERHALASLELAEKLGDGGLRAGALAVLATSRFSLGEPDALALTEEALQLAGACNPDERLVGATADREHLRQHRSSRQSPPAVGAAPPRVGRARRDDRGQHSLASRQGRALCRPLGARGGRCSPGLGDRQAVRGERSLDDLGGRARRSPSRRPGACARTGGAGTGGGIEPLVHLPSRGRARARRRLERGPTWCR